MLSSVLGSVVGCVLDYVYAVIGFVLGSVLHAGVLNSAWGGVFSGAYPSGHVASIQAEGGGDSWGC